MAEEQKAPIGEEEKKKSEAEKTVLKLSTSETITDVVNRMVVISYDEYKAKTEEEQKDWVKYSPNNSESLLNKLFASNNQLASFYDTVGAQLNMLSPLTNGSMTQLTSAFVDLLKEIKTILDLVNDAEKLLKTIDELVDNEILEPIIKPLSKLLFMLFKMIGGMMAIIFCIIYNPEKLIDPYVAALRSIDTDRLKEYFNSEGEVSVNIKSLSKTNSENVSPSPEIQNKIMEQINAMNAQITAISTAIDTLDTAKKTAITLEDGQNEYLAMMRMIATYGLSKIKFLGLQPIQAIMDGARIGFKEKQKEWNEKDFTKNANKMKDGVNNFIKGLPIQYISKEDAELLKALQKRQKMIESGQVDPDDPATDPKQTLLRTSNDFQDAYKLGRNELYEELEYNKYMKDKAEELVSKGISFKTGIEEGHVQGMTEYQIGYNDGYKMGLANTSTVVFTTSTMSMVKGKGYSAGADKGYAKGLEEYKAKAELTKEPEPKVIKIGRTFVYGFQDPDYLAMQQTTQEKYMIGFRIACQKHPYDPGQYWPASVLSKRIIADLSEKQLEDEWIIKGWCDGTMYNRSAVTKIKNDKGDVIKTYRGKVESRDFFGS